MMRIRRSSDEYHQVVAYADIHRFHPFFLGGVNVATGMEQRSTKQRVTQSRSLPTSCPKSSSDEIPNRK